MKDRDAIRHVAREANANPACLGVIAWMHTFSPAKMWIVGLEALAKPLLHLHTQANVALPWSTRSEERRVGKECGSRAPPAQWRVRKRPGTTATGGGGRDRAITGW